MMKNYKKGSPKDDMQGWVFGVGMTIVLIYIVLAIFGVV